MQLSTTTHDISSPQRCFKVFLALIYTIQIVYHCNHAAYQCLLYRHCVVFLDAIDWSCATHARYLQRRKVSLVALPHVAINRRCDTSKLLAYLVSLPTALLTPVPLRDVRPLLGDNRRVVVWFASLAD